MNQPYQFQNVIPLTPTVKKLIIINVSVWITLVLILQQFFMNQDYVFVWFGLQPLRLISNFWLWQPFTYMFLHSTNVFHVLFNMILLWWLGAELEQRWGSQFFLLYYMVCGVGAAAIYILGVLSYYFATGDSTPLQSPVVGASGAIFGLLLAYGIIFGERIVYLFFMFAMKAKYFVLILGGIEVVTLLNSGFNSNVANLAHLGGLVAGFVFLILWTRLKGQKVRKSTRKRGRRLKLVINKDQEQEPKYWN